MCIRDRLESGDVEAHLDAIAEAAIQEQEDANARSQGLCPHCWEPEDDCTGYKCWIR